MSKFQGIAKGAEVRLVLKSMPFLVEPDPAHQRMVAKLNIFSARYAGPLEGAANVHVVEATSSNNVVLQWRVDENDIAMIGLQSEVAQS